MAGPADDDGAVGGAGAAEAPIFAPNLEFVRAREKIYEKVVDKYPTHRGKEISAEERESKGMRLSTLTYGEIRFEPYALAFQKIRDLYGGLDKPGYKFVDLGSGTGKPVFAAALLHAWRECIGIEILEGLHAASLEMLDTIWRSAEIQADLPEETKAVDVRFDCGDITTADWSDADVIFANSTCFDEALMAKLATAAERMKTGSFCVTFTKRLPSAKWSVLETSFEQMSWGGATVFIQKKVLE